MIKINQEKLKAKKLEDCKTTARQLLVESDWSELPSVIEQLSNAAEWKAYRLAVRKLLVEPVEIPNFPNPPKALWKKL